MGDEERTDLPPYRCGGQPLHHRRDLRVPLHEFGGDPGCRVRGVHRIPDQGRQFLKELAVILSDQRKFRQGLHLPAGDGDDPLNELPDAAVFCRDHRDDRETEGLLQRFGVHPDPLRLRHIQHVHGHDHRRAEEEEFREEVEAPLKGGGVDQKDDDVGRLVDDELPGDPLLLREGRQAVRAGEIDDPHLHAVRGVRALLFFDGLPGPVADMLRKPRQDVEHRRFSRVGLAGEGDEERPALRARTLLFMGEAVDEDLRGLARTEGDARVGHLDDDQPAACMEKTDPRIEDDPHPRQPADQGVVAGDRMDDSLFALSERVTGAGKFRLRASFVPLN